MSEQKREVAEIIEVQTGPDGEPVINVPSLTVARRNELAGIDTPVVADKPEPRRSRSPSAT